MTTFYFGFAVFLLLSLAGSLARIIVGPTRADRLMAGQLLGTTGVAVLLVLAEAFERSGIRDVALLLAVLAAFNVVVFIQAGRKEVAEHPGRAP